MLKRMRTNLSLILGTNLKFCSWTITQIFLKLVWLNWLIVIAVRSIWICLISLHFLLHLYLHIMRVELVFILELM